MVAMTHFNARRGGAASSSRASRYLAAVGLAAGAVAVTTALRGHDADTFAPLIGAVAVSCWYGGLGPGLLSIGLAWTAAWYAFVSPRWSWEFTDSSELLRWLVPLLVSIVIVWFSWALRRAGTKAEVRAESAEQERFKTESLQQLASELSSALTPSDVAHTLVERVPGTLGAAGGALGLLEADVLQIVDPAGSPRQTIPPGTRLPLDALAPIVIAARTGEVTFASTRDRFEQDFPDGAALAPYAAGALAMPLRAGGKIVGSMGFPFREPDAIDDEVLAVARLAADLGGQALERAGLYEQERQSREGLDRIVRLAPRFDSESPESVVEMICKEAMATFGSDVAQLWTVVDGEVFEVAWREPASDRIPPGTRVQASDFPGLAENLEKLEPLFIVDSLVDVRGVALEHARTFGIRSSLRVPIAVRGRAERVLALQWTRVLPRPSQSAIVLARRFADQAGLALEHAERRVAQAAAFRNAEETRRLLDVTASLAAALEPSAVADATLRQAFAALGAGAGVVVRLNESGQLAIVASSGYPADVLAGWQTFALDADVPLADAVRRNTIVAVESPAERARRYPTLARTEGPSNAWLTIPLVAGGRVVGGLGLSFSSSRSFSDGDREFALALSRQAGQALERSALLETEHAARMRAERMASDLAQLHAIATSLARAGAASDVTRIVGEHLIEGVRASSAGIYTLGPGGRDLVLLEAHGGAGREEPDSEERIPLDGAGPLGEAVRSGRAVWLTVSGDEDALPWPATGHPEAGTLGVVPLIVEQETLGALFVLFDEKSAPSDEERRFVETVASQAAQPLERSRLFDEERRLRQRADRLQQLTTALSSALTSQEVVDLFLDQLSAAVGASAVAMCTAHDGAGPSRWHGETSLVPQSWLDPGGNGATPVRDVIERGSPLYFPVLQDLVDAYPAATELDRPGGYASFAFVPVAVARQPYAVTVLAWDRPVRLSVDVRSFIDTIASQCGQAIDRAQRYETERTIAETLQRSVLPETLPSLEGATVAARYLPGTAAMDVGGDWFDTILLADGRIGFAVGDVVGKGVDAASTMAQLRNGMRALTLDSSDPGEIVTKLNRLLDGYTDAPFATLALVTIDPVTLDATLVSAGHLPPLVLAPGRQPRMLEGPRGLPLGVDPSTVYEPWSTTLEPGSVIVLYTDGLVERRDRSLDEGLRLLAEAAGEARLDAEHVVDLLLDRLIGDDPRGDDIAVLAVELDRAPLGTFSMRLPADRESLGPLRDELERWLDRGGISDADRRDLLLAAWEASANAVEHAVSPAEPLIGVEATLVGDRVRIEVSDTGGWQEPRERPDRGLGLRLIQSLMTSLAVERDDHGTRVVMERTLSREKAGEGGSSAAGHRQ